MVSFPPCKINLGLHILRKRSDGYHDVETCFYPVPWTDILEIIPAQNFSFTSSGDIIQGDPLDNLCIKAYNLLKKDFKLPPVSMHLHKVIPMGAGLGGGSSDAAYTLRMLDSIFNLNLSSDQLHNYAAQIGSDCAFFVYNKPMIGTARGEVLSFFDINLTGQFLVLVKPDIHVSTASAYAGVSPHVPAVRLNDVLSQPLSNWADLLQNDFEKSVFKSYPDLNALKNTLYQMGAVYASMSGSGSTVFGIFNQPVEIANLSHHTCWSSIL